MKKTLPPTGIRFPDDIKKEAKQNAASMDRSLSWYTVAAVREKNERLRQQGGVGHE